MTSTLINRISVFNKIGSIPVVPFWKYYCKDNTESSSEEPKQIRKKESKPSQDSSKKLNDLLQSLINHKSSKSTVQFSTPKSKLKSKKGNIKEQLDDEKKLTEAAKNVAESLGGDVKRTQSELLSKLQHSTKEAISVSQLIKNMKIETQKTPTKSDFMRQSLKSKPRRTFIKDVSTTEADRINLFGGDRLNIFTDLKSDSTKDIQLKTWQSLQDRELRLAVTHPPSNYFQQMILWTEQGKLWKFPIDNEQGMEKEQNVYFADHVFLEPLLDDWCPKQGPVRHFMELVCVGLSKNHYLSADDKRAHIEWYKNYFNEKMDLLKEVGAVPVNSTTEMSSDLKN